MTIDEAKKEARRKAFDSLARYKFMMFGYHAALWVTLNKLDTNKEQNPFTSLVNLAKGIAEEQPTRDEVRRYMLEQQRRPIKVD